MGEKFALFLFNEDEPCGGVNDLVMIGSMAECVARAEATDHETVAQIVEVQRLTVVKYGEWFYTPKDIETGLASDIGKILWSYRWATPESD